MKIEYDKEALATYVQLNENDCVLIEQSVFCEGDIIVDYCADNGFVYGVEFLLANKNKKISQSFINDLVFENKFHKNYLIDAINQFENLDW